MNYQKMKTCSTCGKLIASSAKFCPFCGAKNAKPFYRRVWFWLLSIWLAAFLMSYPRNDKSAPASSVEETTEAPIVYTEVTAEKLIADLNSNAMNASEKYKGNYYEVTGELRSIDAQGGYITLVDPASQFTFGNINCYVKGNEAVKQQIKTTSLGDTIKVKGKITDVGEVLGYSMTIDSVSK